MCKIIIFSADELHRNINVLEIAFRYEKIIFENSNYLEDYSNTSIIAALTRKLPTNESPHIFVKEIFQLPINDEIFDLDLDPFRDTPPLFESNVCLPVSCDNNSSLSQDQSNFDFNSSLLNSCCTGNELIKNQCNKTNQGIDKQKMPWISRKRNVDNISESNSSTFGESMTDSYNIQVNQLSDLHQNSNSVNDQNISSNKKPPPLMSSNKKPPPMISSNKKLPPMEDYELLIEFHHAATCDHNDMNINNPCVQSIHCNEMKILWEHVKGCNSSQCEIFHCSSSNKLLAHYKQCQNESCSSCSPLKQKIRKQRSKSTTTSSMCPTSNINNNCNYQSNNNSTTDSVDVNDVKYNNIVPYPV